MSNIVVQLVSRYCTSSDTLDNPSDTKNAGEVYQKFSQVSDTGWSRSQMFQPRLTYILQNTKNTYFSKNI